MKHLILAAALLAALVTSAAAQAGDAAWAALTQRLERASMNGAVAELRTVRGELLRLLAAKPEPARERLVQYSLAYIASRMVFNPQTPEREQGDLLADAVTRLQAVVSANPKDAEAHALLGAVYGLQIAMSPLKGMLLGPRAGAALGRAASLEPDNPRVLLQQAINAYNTPALFGGSVDEAERLLRRSLERFAKQPADAPWPSWGPFYAHAWLGQALLHKGNRAGARAEFDRALAIAPGSGWVRYVLVPALERDTR
jgi:tetratricopeptide (TPR) repeat protein